MAFTGWKAWKLVENPSMKSFAKFKPQDGFGGNPLDNGNWWMMTPQQMERAIKYGCLNRFSREENIFADYDKVWKGYTRHEGKNGGWYDLCKNPPNDWYTDNKAIVELLSDNGYKIKVIPTLENIKTNYNVEWSNPDIILNGRLADIKNVDTSIKSRLKSAKEQRLRNVVLNIPDSFTEQEIKQTFSDWKHGRLTVVWIYKGQINIDILK